MLWIFWFYFVKWWFSCANAHSVDNSAGLILVLGRSSPVEAGGSPQPLWILGEAVKAEMGLACTPERSEKADLCDLAGPLTLLSPQEDVWEMGGQGSRRLLLLGAESHTVPPLLHQATFHQPISWAWWRNCPKPILSLCSHVRAQKSLPWYSRKKTQTHTQTSFGRE